MNQNWVPLLGFLIVSACHPLVLGVTLILVGELFPTEIRTVSIGIVNGMEYLAFAFATEAFLHLLESLHFYGLNFYYGIFCLLMTMWGTMTIRDIDYLSLVEIEKNYYTEMVTSEASTHESKSEPSNYRTIE